MNARRFLASLLFTFGCGNEVASAPDAQTPSAPEIIELTAAPGTLTDISLINVSATVLDADGDLAAGRLETESGVVLGPFVAISSSGYVMALSWNAVNDAEPITYAGEPIKRTLYARFIDRREAVTRAPLELELACSSGFPCSGTCQDLEFNSDHCGRCDHACTGSPRECRFGRCDQTPSECVEVTGEMSCDEICAQQLGTCTGQGCTQFDDRILEYYASPETCERYERAAGGTNVCAQKLTPANGAYVRCCCHL